MSCRVWIDRVVIREALFAADPSDAISRDHRAVDCPKLVTFQPQQLRCCQFSRRADSNMRLSAVWRSFFKVTTDRASGAISRHRSGSCATAS